MVFIVDYYDLFLKGIIGIFWRVDGINVVFELCFRGDGVLIWCCDDFIYVVGWLFCDDGLNVGYGWSDLFLCLWCVWCIVLFGWVVKI